MIRLYTAAYGNSGMNARQVLEEMVCDAMGKMNAFATEETSTVAGEVGQFLRDLRKTALETQTDGQKNSAQEGVKFSRQFLAAEENRDITALAKRVLDGNYKANEKVYLGTVSTRNAARIQEITGINVDGFRVAIEARQIEHILKRHGADGTADNSMADISNIARIEYALNNPDSIVLAGKTSAYVYMRDGKNRKADTVRYGKGIGEKTYYAVQAVADTKAKTLHIVTAFIGEGGYKNGTPQFTNAISSGVTSENAAVDVPNNNISQSSEDVKQKYSRELDSEYMELAKDPEGNSTELRKMVDQAAEQQGYKTLFYHGSKKGGGFTEFRDWQYFTPKKEYAERYAQRGNPDSLYSVFVKMENPFDTRNAKARRIFQKARGELGLSEIQGTGLPDWTDGYDLADYIDENGLNYDAIVLDEGGDLVNGKPVSRGLSYVVRKSNQVKSADAVVYDDNGKVIPLSERFNSDKGDIRYSRELTTDGRIVAVVDEDILSNLDLSNWNQETKEAAQKAAAAALLKFQDGIAVEGITRKVNRISRKEFTRSKYTNELFWWNSTAFLDKMRAANNLDDVVIATTDWARDGKLKHPRTDNFVDFDHGTTLIASGDAKYEAEVVVGITDKGDAVFYDIVNMKQGDFSIKKEESSPTATTNKSPGSIFEDSSKRNVAQQSENVKQKYSRELETVEELQRQNELLQEQRDYWRGQTEVTGRAATKWQIRALANQLMRRYHSQTEVDEIVPELEWLVKNVTKADWDISYADITNAAEAVAASVVGGSGANYNADQWGTGQEIKDFLRQNAIKADNTADSPLLYSVRMLTWAEVSWSMLPSS